jgi:hypothetical protein
MQYNCCMELAGFCVHYIKEQTCVYFFIQGLGFGGEK